MNLVILICGYLVIGRAEVREVKIPAFKPPSQVEIFQAYFKNQQTGENNRTKKSVPDVPHSVYRQLETITGDITDDIGNANQEIRSGALIRNETGAEGDNAKFDVIKNYLWRPVQSTTYKYPTAVWSSQAYEKLKNGQKFRSKSYYGRSQVTADHVANNFTSDNTIRRNRGKVKWTDFPSSKSESYYGDRITRSDFADRFLEHSLNKYLSSSNLKQTVGNVSVKTFSEILKNITDQKPKRSQSPYDENKAFRVRFREEVILKKKNDTKQPPGKFLEKQLQKRLEKVQDVFNEKNKDKILANMWKYVDLNRTTDASNEKNIGKTEEDSSSEPFNPDVVYITTTSSTTAAGFPGKHNRGTVKYDRKKYKTRTYNEYDSPDDDGDNRNSLKLTAEESSYYRKGRFPSLTFIGQHPEKSSVIPGKPYVDYPVHSFPPPTKFKCPKFKGEKPKMVADKETRCQVFYVCTGDGPTTAMLCPNGTMFNENFLVCDWWYNVHC